MSAGRECPEAALTVDVMLHLEEVVGVITSVEYGALGQSTPRACAHHHPNRLHTSLPGQAKGVFLVTTKGVFLVTTLDARHGVRPPGIIWKKLPFHCSGVREVLVPCSFFHVSPQERPPFAQSAGEFPKQGDIHSSHNCLQWAAVVFVEDTSGSSTIK